MGVWVCVSSETVWFSTLIGQKQGSLDSFLDFPASRWFQHKENRHRYKVYFRIHLSLPWGFEPAGRAVYTHSGSPLGL